MAAEREARLSPYSSRTHTEWDFISRAAADDEPVVLPLLQLDIEMATDTAGRAGRHDKLSVTAAHLPGAAGAGQVRETTVELSYDDGRTWHRADRGHDGRFRLDAPRKAAFVSLRASAEDTAGNTVNQTVDRAFGLR